MSYYVNSKYRDYLLAANIGYQAGNLAQKFAVKRYNEIMAPVPKFRSYSKKKPSQGVSKVTLPFKVGKNYGKDRSGGATNSTRSNAVGIVTDNPMGAVTKYRSKKFNKRRAMKWKRFQSKVLKATEKQEAPHIRQFRQSNAITVAAGGQYWVPFTLNGYNGDVSVANDINDQADLSILVNRMSDPAAGTVVTGSQCKICSAAMDLEITNFTTTANPGVPVILDVYKVVCRKDEKVSTVATDMNTLGKAYQNGFSQQVIGDGLGGTPVILNSQTLGCTPFDSPGFCQRWKILNKRRIMLTVGSSISFTMGDPRCKILNSDISNGFGVRKGHSKGYLILASACITGNLLGAVTSPAFNLAFESLRTYRYRVIRDSIATGVSATS